MMSIADPLRSLAAHRLLPVLTLDDPEQAETLAAALVIGGLAVVEVTLRTPAATAALRTLSGHPELLVGAGTVLRPEQVDLAADCGARFVVSPGLSLPVVERARRLALPLLPGVATPTELMHARALGFDAVKLFPAQALGGPAFIRSIAAPFPQMSFVPTGGIGARELGDYLALGAVLAVGGSWMAPRDMLRGGQAQPLGERIAAAVALAAPAPGARPGVTEDARR